MKISWPKIQSLLFRNLMVFRKSWTIYLFWMLIEPLFFLVALGYGLGSFVNNIEGVSYVEFFFPALICNSAMMVAYFTSTYDNFSKLTYQRLYQTQILAPLLPSEIALAEILWAAVKGTLSAVAMAALGSVLGLVETWRIFPVFIVVFLLSMFFASIGMLITTYVQNYDQIIYPTSGLIIPMSLFSGTYFPISELPFGLHHLTQVLPLTHAVVLVRDWLLKGFLWSHVWHLVVLISFLLFFLRWAIRRLNIKLSY